MSSETPTIGQQAPAAVSASAAAERRFAFTFGDGRWWVPASTVLTEIPIGAHLQPLPNAPPLLAGAINVRGAIRLVFDPLRFSGEVPVAGTVRRILLMDRDEHCAGVLISGEPVLHEVRSAPHAIDAGPFSAFASGLLIGANGLHLHEFDHRGWFRHLREHAHSDSLSSTVATGG